MRILLIQCTSPLSLESWLLESKMSFPRRLQAPTLLQAFTLPSACLKAESTALRPGAVLSCLLGQGLESRPRQETGAPPSAGKRGSLVPAAHLGIPPCWRNWFPGPDSQPHLLEGVWGLGPRIWSVFLGVVYTFSSAFGESTYYLCISWPFTKLINP